LNDVTSGDAAAISEATPSLAMASTPVAGATLQSSTTVDAALDDIISGEHAINVHESAERIDVYIACGDVTGEAADGMLTVELQELNGSGASGQAMLTDNGDGTTTVELHLTQSGSGMATPAA
jgi:FlaG/FlaF family flagellin (archaellin)